MKNRAVLVMVEILQRINSCGNPLVRGHENGLCDHGETRSQPFGTIYSWVAELGTGKVHVAHGRPCENEYQVITLETS
jgi:hypothetical protein